MKVLCNIMQARSVLSLRVLISCVLIFELGMVSRAIAEPPRPTLFGSPKDQEAKSVEPAIVDPNSVAQDPITAVFKRFNNNIKRFTLSNGLRVVYFYRAYAPVFAGQLWVKVGGVDETSGITGLSHFLEHMAFKGTHTIGTKDYDAEQKLLLELETLMQQSSPNSNDGEKKAQIAEVHSKLQQIWVDNEFSTMYKQHGAVGLNAATGKDFTYYQVELPKTEFEFWCWMESDRLLFPVFRQFYQEREVIQEERRMRTDDDPSGKLYEVMLASAFLSHPYRLPTIGWPSDIKNLSMTSMEQFYKSYYRPDNMVISIVGDLDFAEVQKLTQKYFGRIPVNNSKIREIVTQEVEQIGPRDVAVVLNAEPQLIMAYHKPTYPNHDDLQFAILHSLLSDGASSLLHKELVLDKKLASFVSTSETPGERFPPIFTVSAAPRKGVPVKQLTDAIQAILDRLKNKNVSKVALNSAKRRVEVSFLSGLDSNDGLAQLLGKTELLWKDARLLSDMYHVMAITTSDDIKRIVNAYLNVNNRTVAHIDSVINHEKK